MEERDELDEVLSWMGCKCLPSLNGPGVVCQACSVRAIRARERRLAELAKEMHSVLKEGWIFKADDWLRRYEEAVK